MAVRPTTFRIWRALPALLVLTALLWTGCSSPRERYKVLSFFFDGVPNPDAPPKTAQVIETSSTGPARGAIVSRHKPFVEDKCASCHRSASGEIMEFEEAFKTCANCHKTITKAYPRMHGPVATGSCRWCHTGHESTQVALLKDPPIQVCTQCHDQQILGPKPVQHTDGKTSCLNCHFGHGGTAANFLKPDWEAKWPGTPATLPAGAPPGTAPAPAPVQLPANPAPAATPRGGTP